MDEAMARQQCNGTGCCSYYIFLYGSRTVSSLNLQFVRNDDPKANPKQPNSSLWDRISVESDGMWLSWVVADEPSCAAASVNKTKYACVSKHSTCTDKLPSYVCMCEPGYSGNPYVADGCMRDTGYNPAPRKANCSRSCGDITVPFPFGLDEGCSARKELQLDCTDKKLFWGEFLESHYVSHINISEGTMGVTRTDSYVAPGYFYTSSAISQDLNWVVANLTCQEAPQNITTYACISLNSACLGVNSANEDSQQYVGYRCKCKAGFQGNPYVLNGCQDIDECAMTPGICSGQQCQNTIGSYHCTECPYKTHYDSTVMRCIHEKRKLSLLSGIMIGFGAGFGILLLALCATFAILRWRRHAQRRLRRQYFHQNKGLLLEQLISSDENTNDKTKIFSLEELEKATNNFDETRILGRGGHGMVYKGILSDQRVVAIKVSKVIEQSEINQFINEVAILSQISHRNIVKLFGCCLETKVPLLVYDFISNGSLYDILHPSLESKFSLSWEDCLRIAAEAAGALYYLHSAASVSVFHRDVKSSNILLDANYTAKVSDFGASRLVPIDETHVDTLVQGTFGYLDPEYYHTGQLNEKSDVYSFGVVLVELLIRRKPIFTNETGSTQNLSSYFLSEFNSRPIEEIIAAEIREEATKEEISSVASLAKMCLMLRGQDRPTMKQVEMALHTLLTKRAKYRIIGTRENNHDMQPLLYS
ncbi:putative wall-associated receptor kinase-like 16 [Sorghum bicolor]|nr:putative wall-associated receptor kinase-like 16 [Sorghum bicolor]|eukprot:XP_021317488.1 putative wall-associated receptor kinase-like 16 [Sorghum bicolor]